MNGVVLVTCAIVILAVAYRFYGKWLAKTWGIDPNALTPAHRLEDGQDYTPSSKFTVFANQFSSITGARTRHVPDASPSPRLTPASLWLMIGVFPVLSRLDPHASMKNDGKSMGVLIEKYIGTTGRRLFLLFCWVFSLLVIAAFGDIVATTFNGFDKDGSMVLPNAAAASISMLFIFVAIAFGLFIKNFNPSEKVRFVIAIVLLIAMLYVGIDLPIYLDRMTWLYIIFAYIFFASIMPMWLLKQPRDYISAFLLLMMIAGGVIGIFIAQPTLNMPAFTSFSVGGKDLFPILFITIACGAVSGLHSLVSSGTSSKTLDKEQDSVCRLRFHVRRIGLRRRFPGHRLRCRFQRPRRFGHAVPDLLRRRRWFLHHVRPVPDGSCLHHDHVRIGPGPDDPRCRRPYRPYVLPGTVQRR